jgi:hypothetical protein
MRSGTAHSGLPCAVGGKGASVGVPTDTSAAEAWFIPNIAPAISAGATRKLMTRPDRKRGIRNGMVSL